ncbi:putative Xaa-Pro aminopeptidase [Dirofilaria immitis]
MKPRREDQRQTNRQRGKQMMYTYVHKMNVSLREGEKQVIASRKRRVEIDEGRKTSELSAYLQFSLIVLLSLHVSCCFA